MSPNSRQRKKYHSDKLISFLQSRNLGEHMTREVIIAAITKLNYNDILKSKNIFNGNKGRKMTSFVTMTVVWEFWHANSSESSDTMRPAKLRQSNQNKIQSGLEFPPSVKLIKQRERLFYQSMWMIMHYPYQVLYNQKFLKQHPDHVVSSGTFFALKPFYITGVSQRDFNVCVCKLHLHA